MTETGTAIAPAGATSPAAKVARRVTTTARGRLVDPLPDEGWRGWAGPLAITVVAGVLAFWHLTNVTKYIFDEVYYPEQAQDLLRYGVEYNQKDSRPDFVVHPPVGKWTIAVGEELFGNHAFGWRFMVALLGTLSVLVLARAARRMFRSTLLGCVAAALLTLDGQHFVHSRTALLDSVLTFYALCAFACLLVDRDASRERLARGIPPAGELSRFGPGLGWRPWRLAAGVLLGLACGTKWSGLFFVAAFGLMSAFWDLGARRTAGVRRPWSGTLLRDAPAALASLVLVPFVVYVSSWFGWFHSGPDRAYDRDWASTHGGTPWVPDALRSLWHYHTEMYHFNTTLTTFHQYRANPWSWLILGRPTDFWYAPVKQGVDGCRATECVRASLALGTPAVWWAAALCLPVLLVLWAGRRDWRAGAILAGVAAGYLPWFNYQQRTIFSFYAIAFLPYLVLAVTFVLGLVLGPRTASPNRRAVGAALVGAYLLLVVADFAWLYPVLSTELIPTTAWRHRMWFTSWI